MLASPQRFRHLLRPAVIGGALLLSILPARWSGYGPWLSNVVEVALGPVSRPLRAASSRLRHSNTANILGERAQLSDELRERDTMILSLQRRVRELETVNAELQGLRSRLGDAWVYRRASVVGRSGDAAAGTLNIDVGVRDGLRPGCVVVSRANLVGRVVQVAPSSAVVRPLTSPGSLIEVVFTPPVLPTGGALPPTDQQALLKAAGPDRLVADDVDRRVKISVGDYARLSDAGGPESWPAPAQGMIVGVVTSVKPNEDDPLRQRVEVRPLISPRFITAITVIEPGGAGEPEASR